MARTRKPKGSTNEASTTTHTNVNVNERGIKMAGLSNEQIAALLGKTRTKGDYVVKLNEFLESGEGGICVNEQWVELKDKKAATLKQGFDSAKDNKEAKDGAENVKVIANEDKVFLINLGGVDADALAGTAAAE